MSKTVFKIFKDKDVFLTSERKTIQGALIGTVELTCPPSTMVTREIPHGFSFVPFCVVQAFFGTGEYGYECPFPAATGVSGEFADFDVNDKNIILKLSVGAGGPITRKFKYFIFSDNLIQLEEG